MKLALRLAVSLLLITALFLFVVDWREVLGVLSGLTPGWLALAGLLITLDRALMTYKWALLLGVHGYSLSLLRGMTIYCASMVWGTVLPATVGADIVRATLVTRAGCRGVDAIASIVVERIIGFVAALLMGLISLAALRVLGVLDADYDRLWYAGAAGLALSLGLIFVSMSASMAERVMKLMPAAVRRLRIMERLEQLGGAYRSLGANRGVMTRFSVLTLLEQTFNIAIIWALARGLGVEVDALVMLGVVPLSILISRLPISFDGLGVFEAIFTGLLALAGVPPAAAVAIALAGRILHLLCFLPWWFVQVLRSGRMRPPPPAAPAQAAGGIAASTAPTSPRV